MLTDLKNGEVGKTEKIFFIIYTRLLCRFDSILSLAQLSYIIRKHLESSSNGILKGQRDIHHSDLIAINPYMYNSMELIDGIVDEILADINFRDVIPVLMRYEII